MYKTIEEICEICKKPVYEYDKKWECKKNHNWRKGWRKDKNSKKYKNYLEKRNIAMKISWRKKLDKLNKKPLSEYTSRRGSIATEKRAEDKRKRYKQKKVVEKRMKF